MCSGPSGGCGAACEELATAAVLLLQEFPVPEPSPPFHCDMFESISLLESLFQSPPRKSVVGKQACVSSRWYFSMAAEKSPSVNRLYCQPVEKVERDLKTWGVLGWPNKSIVCFHSPNKSIISVFTANHLHVVSSQGCSRHCCRNSICMQSLRG